MNGEHPNAREAPTTDRQLRMDPELKAKWLEALRSGRYRQAHKSLKETDCFCCLGVALDVIDAGQWSSNGWGFDDETDETKFDMSDTQPLSAVLGISGNACDFLADLNDGTQTCGLEKRRWSFTEIADYIEKNL